jgi:hypothetical protein
VKEINIFCFGFGQVAKEFINKIKSENLIINLSTTSTGKSCKKKIDDLSYENFFFKDEAFDDKLIKNLREADYILISIPPANGIDLVIKNFFYEIKDSKFKWITYLSATSVYGDHDGNWVNEDSLTNPTSSNGIARLEAEKSWLNLSKKNNQPIQIKGLSGIYSKENNIQKEIKIRKS